MILLPKLSLCSPVLNRNADTEFWVKQKIIVYCFARQRGPQWANALRTVCPTLEGVSEESTVFKEEGLIGSWTFF